MATPIKTKLFVGYQKETSFLLKNFHKSEQNVDIVQREYNELLFFFQKVTWKVFEKWSKRQKKNVNIFVVVSVSAIATGEVKRCFSKFREVT